MALFVWVVASNAADPIQERRLAQSIPVQVLLDDGLVMIDQPGQTRSVRVTMRAQQSVLSLLTAEDVVVVADLRGKGPGTHIVEFDVDTSRRVVNVDTQPRQMRVILEAVQSRQVEVVAAIQEPPTGYQLSEPVFSETQVMVSGPASQVELVMHAQIELDFSSRPTSVNIDARLIPVDVDGREVDDVELNPAVVNVEVDVALLEGVEEIAVSPNIDLDSLPEGYNLESFTSEPQTVIVSGNLSRMPELLETDLILLTDRTEDFEITVPIDLPPGRLFILSEPQEVTVSIQISPVVVALPFEDVPVTTIGQSDDFDYDVSASLVTVLVTGPQVELEALDPDDLQVVVDVTGLEPGTHEVAPLVFNGQVHIDSASVSISPATVAVTVEAEVTQTPSAASD